MRRVAQQVVEVDHGVEGAAGADPVIDLLAQGFLFRRVVGIERRSAQCALEGCQRAPDNAEIVGVGLGGELQELLGQGFESGQGFFAHERRSRPADVVDANEQDHRLDAGLGQDIAVEAGGCFHPHRIVQQPGAGYAGVDTAHPF